VPNSFPAILGLGLNEADGISGNIQRSTLRYTKLRKMKAMFSVSISILSFGRNFLG
jgi:hypothetical protein